MKPFLSALLMTGMMMGQQLQLSSPTTPSDGFLHISQSKVKVEIAGAHVLRIFKEDGSIMVSVDNDGMVSYGNGVKPTDAAKEFWEQMATYYPSVCADASKLSPPQCPEGYECFFRLKQLDDRQAITK